MPNSNSFRAPTKAAAAEQASIYSAMSDTDRRLLFFQWKQTFGRQYSGAENDNRFSLFQATLDAVVSINADAATTWWAGLTKFADQTADERRSILMKFTPPPSDSGAPTAPGRRLLAGTAVDWVTAGFVTPVKDQGVRLCWIGNVAS